MKREKNKKEPYFVFVYSEDQPFNIVVNLFFTETMTTIPPVTVTLIELLLAMPISLVA